MARGTRRDPYKNFNFRVLFGAAALGSLAVGIASRILSALRRGKGGGPVSDMPSGSRQIEGVGTATPGFVGTTPKRAKRRSSGRGPNKRARSGRRRKP